MDITYDFTAELWEYPGQAAWHFISLPSGYTADIKELTKHNKRGFGSVKVTVVLGKSQWDTSIFPDNKSGCYMLPVKKEVRSANSLKAGDMVAVTLIMK